MTHDLTPEGARIVARILAAIDQRLAEKEAADEREPVG